MVGLMVYVKFGPYHGQKAQILGIDTKDGQPAFILRVPDGTVITKKQKNTIKMLPVNK
ncbi:hypothetical protein NX029_26400 [Cytobacillus firmus]|nr:hypothetical protein [Cytobacillus firmus]